MKIEATPEELAALVMELHGQRKGLAVDDDTAITSIAQAACDPGEKEWTV